MFIVWFAISFCLRKYLFFLTYLMEPEISGQINMPNE